MVKVEARVSYKYFERFHIAFYLEYCAPMSILELPIKSRCTTDSRFRSNLFVYSTRKLERFRQSVDLHINLI